MFSICKAWLFLASLKHTFFESQEEKLCKVKVCGCHYWDPEAVNPQESIICLKRIAIHVNPHIPPKMFNFLVVD